jgi:hypothetical protein
VYRHDTTSVTEQFGPGLTHQVYDSHICPVDGAPLRTVCGRYITPAPMSAPLGRPCPACTELLDGARPELPGTARRRGGRLGRLLGR